MCTMAPTWGPPGCLCSLEASGGHLTLGLEMDTYLRATFSQQKHHAEQVVKLTRFVLQLQTHHWFLHISVPDKQELSNALYILSTMMAGIRLCPLGVLGEAKPFHPKGQICLLGGVPDLSAT